jgi:hypothetical protein
MHGLLEAPTKTQALLVNVESHLWNPQRRKSVPRERRSISRGALVPLPHRRHRAVGGDGSAATRPAGEGSGAPGAEQRGDGGHRHSRMLLLQNNPV